MSQRSVSGGVQGLRAMFESSNDTSPPSRGRSPAGSVASDSSRPISKVRTSFISVERSGQQVPTLGGRKMSTGEGSLFGDNTNEGNARPKVADDGTPKMNGSTVPSETRNGAIYKEQEIPGGDGAQDSSPKSNAQDGTPSMDVPSANPDKTTTGVEEAPADLLSGDPKTESTASAGAAAKDSDEGLGSVLKGSPFQASPGKSIGQDESVGEATPSRSSPTPGAKSDEPSNINAQPKTPERASKEKVPKSTSKTVTPGPSTLDAKKTPSSTNKASVHKPAEKPANSPQTTKTGNGIGAADKQASKTSSPRQITQPKSRSDLTKGAPRKTVHPSHLQAPTAAKPSTAAAPKSRQTSATGPPSRKATPATKPRPRSPTRPVRLPAAATAPTQSSAAKNDELPSRSPSRASVAGSNKPSARSANTRPNGPAAGGLPSRSKPMRSSMPPQSTANQKPKPRTSTASAKADGGSFLARMMRPTESSAQKTHEKVEVKSPPRKTGLSARRSDVHKDTKGTQQPKSSNDESKLVEPTDQATTDTQAQEHNFGVEEEPAEPSNEAEELDEEPQAAGVNGTAANSAELAEPAH